MKEKEDDDNDVQEVTETNASRAKAILFLRQSNLAPLQLLNHQPPPLVIAEVSVVLP